MILLYFGGSFWECFRTEYTSEKSRRAKAVKCLPGGMGFWYCNSMINSKGCGPDNYSILKTRVLYADTDKMGIVYYANYFRWFEAGRSSYMRRRNLPYTQTEAGGVQLPLTEAGIRYHKPALYEQLLDVKTWVSEITAVQVKFAYEILFEDTVLVRGFTYHAAIHSGKLRPIRVPKELTDALNSVELFTDNPYL